MTTHPADARGDIDDRSDADPTQTGVLSDSVRPVVLALGSPSDPLLGALEQRLRGRGIPVIMVGEPDLFALPFVWQLDASGQRGFLRAGGCDVALADISAVLLRIHRNWDPPEGLHPKDREFVIHETVASWFHVISALTCTTVNRLPLPWWLGDNDFIRGLRDSLALRLEMPATWDLQAVHNPVSVFAVGDQVFARGLEDEALRARVAARAEALGCWARDNGLGLVRLDFEPGSWRLDWVEVMPLLEGKSGPLVASMAAALAALLT